MATYEALPLILQLQEFDVKMIRLMRLKRERQKELDNIQSIKNDCHHQLMVKEGEIIDLKKSSRLAESDFEDAGEKVKRLEEQQSNVKKVDEFNSLSREIAAANREKSAKEQRCSDVLDRMTEEEQILDTLKETLASTTESSQAIVEEIAEGIAVINVEGRGLKAERAKLAEGADAETLHIYERLLKNKRDRVIVPIENRTCSGCHIVLTAQHENLVRKGERLVFCEHCSRIHYWQDADAMLDTEGATKRRRRRATAPST
jgi:predicted  nucleic acid-binding Zn-ribbon protein